mmetsp:Transcript_7622/g.12096  ORF Transcript_7622/g.12096 Transcript_7622/m.12096 type:complete len:129 (-) Transcript_7622:219-605(-)
MVTRCCSPPESSDGRCSILSRSPTIVNKSFARFCRSFLFKLPRTVIGNSTFSNADIVAMRLKVWKTNPILLSRRKERYSSVALESILLPNNSNTPPVMVSMQPIIFSNVVLPPPDGPLRITNSPCRIG